MARYRIQASLGDNRLGLAWIVLRPIFQSLVFGLVFGLIMPKGSRPDNFIPFLVTGIFIFQYFSQTFSAGAKAIVGNKSLVRSLNFPRMLLPIAVVLQNLFELIPMMAVLGVILLVFGEPLTWAWLLTIPVLLIMTLFNTGLALIASRLTVHVRDITQVLPYITRLLFYSSGIFYSLDLVLADRPTLLMLAQYNPVHAFITLVRAQMVSGNEATMLTWGVAAVAAVVFFIVGVVFFWRAEERY